jgi:hypothetical protein
MSTITIATPDTEPRYVVTVDWKTQEATVSLNEVQPEPALDLEVVVFLARNTWLLAGPYSDAIYLVASAYAMDDEVGKIGFAEFGGPMPTASQRKAMQREVNSARRTIKSKFRGVRFNAINNDGDEVEYSDLGAEVAAAFTIVI